MSIRLLTPLATLTLAGALTSHAELLVYEPFDYPDGWLNGQGGAIGTIGTWATTDTGNGNGWRVHPEGELTGIAVELFIPPTGGLNVFDGTIDNLPTSGGFAGMAGPEDRDMAFGADSGTGNLDASIGLDPAVTAKFTAGSTTWFSFVSVHAWDRNQGAPQFMICTDPTVGGPRGLTMSNAGDGIGGGGGPPRRNLQDNYPQFFSGGVNNHTPGGYDYPGAVVLNTGTFGLHDGVQVAFGSGNDSTAAGQLDENGMPRTQTMSWEALNADGTWGAPNIIVGKIEWDGDTGGEDVISLVRFLETDTLSEAAFDAQIALLPALSSRNWASNKPDLDQSQFDTLNFSSLKFFVDEIRLGTTFKDITQGGVAPEVPLQLTITSIDPELALSWESNPGMFYHLRSSTDLEAELSTWDLVEVEGVTDLASTPPLNTATIFLPDDPLRFYRIEEFMLPPVTIFSENFDTTIAGTLPTGWTTGFDAADIAMLTAWELGVPTTDLGNLNATAPLAAHSPENCVGTNLDAIYAAQSSTWLRSPAIDLTTAVDATLTFQEWVDIDDFLDGDRGTLRVLDAGTLAELAVLESAINGVVPEDWAEYSAVLPPAALGRSVVIEFGFASDDNDLGNFDGAGWYIDDIVVTTPAP